MPLISVIVPVYKVEPYLYRCVDSILSQTFSDFELILVDDGSPDDCGAICDEYAAKDQRVRVFHQENRGQAAARNMALDWVFANSDSEYISFVDSDDWVHPRYLELLLEGVRRYQVNICQCGHFETDGSEEAPAFSGAITCISPEEQFVNFYSAFMWDKLFSRSCWQKMRFPEGQIYEDVAIWYKILFSLDKVAIITDPLYYYYRRPDSVVRMNWTVRHFTRIKAWDSIVDYLSADKKRPVYANAVYRYCHIAIKQYDEIGRSNAEDAFTKMRYKVRIRLRMVKMLTTAKPAMKTNGTYLFFFAWTFPIMGWIYWTAKGLVAKIKKLL